MTNFTLARLTTVGALVCGFAGTASWAQQYAISTYAGGVYPTFPAAGTSVPIGYPRAVVSDGHGNVYFGSSDLDGVFKLDAAGIVTVVAGTGKPASWPWGSLPLGDGGFATAAYVGNPGGLAMDTAGNLYIADFENNRIRKVDTNGIITTVAGGGLSRPGNGGQATGAQLFWPEDVAVDGAGNLYIADTMDQLVLKVDTNGIMTTVAGGGSTQGNLANGKPATSVMLGRPTGVAVDTAGNLYIADAGAYFVYKVNFSGIINVAAGDGMLNPNYDGGQATSASVCPQGNLAADAAGNLYIPDSLTSSVRKVDSSGIVTTVAGTRGSATFAGDGGQATNAALNFPLGVAVDTIGRLWIADTDNYRVRKVDVYGVITTVAGLSGCCYSGDGGPATSAQLSEVSGVALDTAGNLFIADGGNARVRKISTAGVIATVAGNGIAAFSGDGGLATSASLTGPDSVAVDGSGNLFITDSFSNRVRKVSTDGIITTVAGNGLGGFSGDGGPATSAQLYLLFSSTFEKFGVAVDGTGNVFVADSSNNAVRRLTPTNQSVLIGAVVDAASQSAVPVSPGKIVTVYGGGLGPSQGVIASPVNGAFGTQLSGTTVSFNGIAAPVCYTSSTQVNAIVPYSISGTTANVTVAYRGQTSSAFSVPVTASSPSFFTSNSTGAGQSASINAVDGTFNSAANPAKIGAYISLYATGEGSTTPAGVDGKLGSVPLPSPNLPVTATVGGIPAVVQYKGGSFGSVAGLMQVNVLIPAGVKPGGYVPVVLQVGDASTVDGAVWIAVSAN